MDGMIPKFVEVDEPPDYSKVIYELMADAYRLEHIRDMNDQHEKSWKMKSLVSSSTKALKHRKKRNAKNKKAAKQRMINRRK